MPSEFNWDADNEEHTSRHDVAPYEAEEAMMDSGRVEFDVHDKGKKGIVGHTEDGIEKDTHFAGGADDEL